MNRKEKTNVKAKKLGICTQHCSPHTPHISSLKTHFPHPNSHLSGITLVALVVTIVVLLILAGVTITALLGDDGIIKKAQNAADLMNNAIQNEQNEMNALLNELDEIIAGNGGGGDTPGGDDQPEIPKGQIVTSSDSSITNVEYSDNTGTAKIPVGFCVVKDSTENPSDINTVASGLVISDVADDDLDNSKHGNQFVWIPVTDYDNNFHLIEGYSNNSLQTCLGAGSDPSNFHLIEGYSNNSLQKYLSPGSNPSREAGASKTEILPGKPNEANTVLGTDESVAMYKSVKENGGFYIARYEAGIAGTTDNYSLSTKTATDGSVKPLSKKGVGVWNSIAWGGTSSVEASDNLPGNDNANGAVKVARSMYTKSSSCGVTSTLCYGVQWDAVLNFIDPDYVNGNVTGFVKDSSNMGNYSGSIATTGSNTDYQQKHVYDLAGNVYEWTMEALGTLSRVNRRWRLQRFWFWQSGFQSFRLQSGPQRRLRGFPSNFIFVALFPYSENQTENFCLEFRRNYKH